MPMYHVLLIALLLTAMPLKAFATPVDDAILLKEKGMSEGYILDHLANEVQKTVENGEQPTLFTRGNTVEADDVARLKDQGFSEDFVRKIEGMPQYLTVGITAVWLTNSTDLVAAPMARIMLIPRSYYEPRVPLWPVGTKVGLKQWAYGQLRKLDANIGYTVIEAELEDGTKEETNYVLLGLSFELNKSALLNGGYAVAVKDVEKQKRQWYAGITVDYNVLKELGFNK